VVLAHAFLALLESRRSLSGEPRRWPSLHSKRTLIQADGVEIYGLTVRRPRKSAIARAKIQTESVPTNLRAMSNTSADGRTLDNPLPQGSPQRGAGDGSVTADENREFKSAVSTKIGTKGTPPFQHDAAPLQNIAADSSSNLRDDWMPPPHLGHRQEKTSTAPVNPPPSGEHMQSRRRIRANPTTDDFQLLCVIGMGAFGRVLQVRNKLDQEIYAMKVISKKVLRRKNSVENMRAERDILMKVNHPFVVGLKCSFRTEKKLFLVMEYLHGGELFFHLRKQGLLLEDTARFYVSEILLALEHLHIKGIIHRDLKPENVLMDAQGHAKLTDFGLAKDYFGPTGREWERREREKMARRAAKAAEVSSHGGGGAEVTGSAAMRNHGSFSAAPAVASQQSNSEAILSLDELKPTRTLCGTTEYMAPEMLRRTGYGKAVDFWSLGALMYEMMVGKAPFRGRTTKDIEERILTAKPKFPSFLRAESVAVMKGLMERNVSKRLGATKSNMFEVGGVAKLKDHKFFKGIRWDGLLAKMDPPPITITLGGDDDVSHFDREFTGMDIPGSISESSSPARSVRSPSDSGGMPCVGSGEGVYGATSDDSFVGSPDWEGFDWVSESFQFSGGTSSISTSVELNGSGAYIGLSDAVAFGVGGDGSSPSEHPDGLGSSGELLSEAPAVGGSEPNVTSIGVEGLGVASHAGMETRKHLSDEDEGLSADNTPTEEDRRGLRRDGRRRANGSGESRRALGTPVGHGRSLEALLWPLEHLRGGEQEAAQNSLRPPGHKNKSVRTPSGSIMDESRRSSADHSVIAGTDHRASIQMATTAPGAEGTSLPWTTMVVDAGGATRGEVKLAVSSAGKKKQRQRKNKGKPGGGMGVPRSMLVTSTSALRTPWAEGVGPAAVNDDTEASARTPSGLSRDLNQDTLHTAPPKTIKQQPPALPPSPSPVVRGPVNQPPMLAVQPPAALAKSEACVASETSNIGRPRSGRSLSPPAWPSLEGSAEKTSQAVSRRHLDSGLRRQLRPLRPPGVGAAAGQRRSTPN
jgi:serine/threonine protein kinase